MTEAAERLRWESSAIGNAAGATVAAILIWTGTPIWFAIAWPFAVSIGITIWANLRYRALP